jgi:glutamate racemase
MERDKMSAGDLSGDRQGGGMQGDSRPIGVFDSGVGGLTVLRALMERLPDERFIYLGDTARLPYGTKSADTVRAYAMQASRLLVDEGVKLIVVACNTASAVAIESLSEALAPVPVIGVIEPGARAGVAATRNGSIAVIATEGTVRGGSYPRAIAALRPDSRVVQQPCPLFVTLAEEGWIDHPASLTAAEHYLGPLFQSEPRPDTLVLGCTHFPVLKGAIRKAIGEEVALVDSAETTAEVVEAVLMERGLEREGLDAGEGNGPLEGAGEGPPKGAGEGAKETGGRSQALRLLATDSPERFARVGEIFLGVPIDPEAVELVDLQ